MPTLETIVPKSIYLPILHHLISRTEDGSKQTNCFSQSTVSASCHIPALQVCSPQLCPALCLIDCPRGFQGQIIQTLDEEYEEMKTIDTNATQLCKMDLVQEHQESG